MTKCPTVPWNAPGTVWLAGGFEKAFQYDAFYMHFMGKV
jgi:hypothetical protein